MAIDTRDKRASAIMTTPGVMALPLPSSVADTASFAHRTSGTAPLAVHFSAIDYTVHSRDTNNVTGFPIGRVRNLSPTGTATLHYRDNGGTDELSYQAPGDAQGNWVPFTADTLAVKLYSGNGVDWVYGDVIVANLPASDTTDTLTLSTYRDTGGIVQPSNVFDPGDADYGSMGYYWWFNDPNAISYTKTNGRNSNTCWGAPVSAHLFTAPGDYTVQLSVWDNDGTRHEYQETITVTDQEPTATIYYADATLGSDSNDGLSPTDQGGGNGPLQTGDALLAKLTADNTIIKFKRGETFQKTTALPIFIANNNCTITAYYNADGSDDPAQPKPLLNLTAGPGITWDDVGVRDTKIMHIHFSGLPGNPNYIFQIGNLTGLQEDLLVYDVEIDTSSCVSHLGGTNRPNHDHFFWVDCHFHDYDRNAFFAGMRRSAILGCRCENAVEAEAEHVFRLWQPDEFVMADSYGANPNTSNLCLKYYSGVSVDGSYVTSAPYGAILRSEFTSPDADWLVGIQTSSEPNGERIEHTIFDGNFVWSDSTQVNVIYTGGAQNTHRNNVVRHSTQYCRSMYRGVSPNIKHHRWLNNVVHNNRTSDSNRRDLFRFVGIDGTTDQDPKAMESKNNIVYSSTASPAAVLSVENADASEIDSDYNLRDSAGTDWSNVIVSGGSTQRTLLQTQTDLSQDLNSAEGSAQFTNVGADDYSLQPTSDAIGAGDPNSLGWVRFDRDGNLRTSVPDAGAYQHGASPPSLPPVPAAMAADTGDRWHLSFVYRGLVPIAATADVEITATLDTSGQVDILVGAEVEITSTLDTAGDVDIRPQLASDVTATLNTAGQVDIVVVGQLAADITATLDTTGQVDIEPPTILESDITGTLDTSGQVDIVIPTYLEADITATLDTSGSVALQVAADLEITATVNTQGLVTISGGEVIAHPSRTCKIRSRKRECTLYIH